MKYMQERKEVYDATMKLVEKDLIRISSGNVSVKTADGNIAITPSGLVYDQMRVEDIVIIDFDGNLVDGYLKPSSEKSLHIDILKNRPEMNAVVHTHSVYAIAFSSCQVEIPVMCIEILAVGGPIPIMPYICPGTKEVGIEAAKLFASKASLKGILMQNHGLAAVGRTGEEAFQNAYKLETGAQIYHLALQLRPDPIALTDAQIEEVFAVYKKPKAA